MKPSAFSFTTMKMNVLGVACALALATQPQSGHAQAEQPAGGKVVDHSEVDTAQAHALTEADIALRNRYSPYVGKGPATPPPIYPKSAHPTHVFFGDTHMHTANSGDAFMGGNTLGPDQAYRLARGEEVISSTGVPIRLSRPLDFLVVADHAEGLGIMYSVADGNPTLMKDSTVAKWSKQLNGTPDERALAMTDVVKSQAGGTLPAAIKDPKVVGPIMKSVWQEYTATAEKFNDPGRFTAMIGYEWTSVPGGNNLHRNVLFRDNKDKADQVFPFSSWNSEDPEKLWDWMAKYEAKTGGRVLAIPHNANLSNGRMFEPVTHAGAPLSKDYAERRARFEVLHELIQTKGNSETHPVISPNDEFAGDLGVAGWDAGNLTMEASPLTKDMMPTNYLRSGLLQGLKYEKTLGVNPFKFGFLGSTDAHNSLMAIEEDNFFGKLPIQEPTAKRWEHLSKTSTWDTKLGPEKKLYSYHYLAAGYAAVWATENTREALWDAMYRKEVYATSGTRMTVRLFGGWDFTAEDAAATDLPTVGYAKGVPMGGTMPKATVDAKAPSFLVAAMKDPQSGNIDRIQIVKGWTDKDNNVHEKIYNVTWSDAQSRKLDANGELPPVGDTVDVATASWTNDIGAEGLTGVWTDPDFDPTERAFYYARAIEIPTPRWTAYDAIRFGIKMPPEVPMTHQERAWTSSIWYTPG
jgi:hypothetical protein